jgi:tetratricopeptide (TPR) repeat protein
VVVNRIYRESGGKPLFAVETVRQMESSGALACKDGNWGVSAEETEIPISVKEVVLRRIERLSKEERRSLEYASVIGMHFDPELLADALKMDHLELLESLEHLHDDHQLVREVEGGYVFEEDKVRKVTYDSISKLRRKEVHRAVAQLLEKKLPNESLYPELSRHYNMAGDSQKAVKYSLLAGQFCLDRQAVAEASTHFELAVELTGKDQAMVEFRPQALEGLADCYITKDKVRADALFEECLSIYHAPKDMARIHRKQAECWLQNALGRGDADKASQHIDQAHGGEGEPLEKAEIEVLLGHISRYNGDFDNMTKHFVAAKNAFAQISMMTKVADVTFIEILMAMQIADIIRANELLAKLRQLNTGIDSNRTDAQVMMCQGALRVLKGEVEQGLADLGKAVGIACPLGNYRLLSTIMTWRGYAHLDAGMMDEALKDFLEGQEYSRTIERTYDAALLIHCESICELKLGKVKEAEGDIKTVLDISTTYHGFLGFVLGRYSNNGLAMLLSAKGDLNASAESFAKGLIDLDSGQPFFSFLERIWRQTYAEVLLNLGRREEAGRQMERIRELDTAFGMKG